MDQTFPSTVCQPLLAPPSPSKQTSEKSTVGTTGIHCGKILMNFCKSFIFILLEGAVGVKNN